MNLRNVSTPSMKSPRHLRGGWPALALAGVLAASMSTAWSQGVTSGGSGAGTSSSGQGAAVTQSGARAASEKSRVVRWDRKFMEEAASAGQMQVQAAQMVANRGADKAVKDYAATLIEQQASANSELAQLASSLGIELPSSLPRGMRNEVEKLAKRSGAEFDREFVREIGIKQHEQEIKRFEKASKDAKEPQLRAWVDKTLPMLQQHLAAAQKLPQAGSEAAASTRTQQQRMGAGVGEGDKPSNQINPGTGGGSMAPYGR